MEQDAANLFGTRLAQVRERRGFSVLDLAERSGVPHQTIYRIESGQTRAPNIYVCARLARALHASLDFLAGTYDEPGLAAADDVIGGEPWDGIGHPAAVVEATRPPQYSTMPSN